MRKVLGGEPGNVERHCWRRKLGWNLKCAEKVGARAFAKGIVWAQKEKEVARPEVEQMKEEILLV